MNATEFSAIRKRLGLSCVAYARVLGYEGKRSSLSRTVRRQEAGRSTIPETVGRLAFMYELHGLPQVYQDDLAIDVALGRALDQKPTAT